MNHPLHKEAQWHVGKLWGTKHIFKWSVRAVLYIWTYIIKQLRNDKNSACGLDVYSTKDVEQENNFFH